MRLSRFEWTDERVALLRQRRAAGASSGQIAAELGCSKDAAAGKLARLGVASPTRRGGLGTVSPRKRAARPNRHAGVVMLDDLYAAEPDAGWLLYAHDLRRSHCRWVLSATAPWTFCGEPVRPKSAWCAAHHARVFVPFRREK